MKLVLELSQLINNSGYMLTDFDLLHFGQIHQLVFALIESVCDQVAEIRLGW